MVGIQAFTNRRHRLRDRIPLTDSNIILVATTAGHAFCLGHMRRLRQRHQ